MFTEKHDQFLFLVKVELTIKPFKTHMSDGQHLE